MIIVTNSDVLIPKQHDAFTIGPVTFIRPEHKGDKALIEHECTHAAQWLYVTVLSFAALAILLYLALPIHWLGLSVLSIGVHGALYRLVPEYRLRAEVQAFREQLKHYPDDRTESLAALLVSNYNLNISYESALKALRSSGLPA